MVYFNIRMKIHGGDRGWRAIHAQCCMPKLRYFDVFISKPSIRYLALSQGRFWYRPSARRLLFVDVWRPKTYICSSVHRRLYSILAHRSIVPNGPSFVSKYSVSIAVPLPANKSSVQRSPPDCHKVDLRKPSQCLLYFMTLI